MKKDENVLYKQRNAFLLSPRHNFPRKTVQFSTENVRHIHWKLFDKWTKKVFDNKNFDRKCSTATLGVEHFPSLTLLFYNIFRHSTSGFIKYSMGFSIYWKNWLLNLLGHGLFSTFEHSDSSTLVDIENFQQIINISMASFNCNGKCSTNYKCICGVLQ